MSTKEEVSADTRARRLLERTNPLIALPGRGLTGDQIPASYFSQEDYDDEKRNLFLNLDNFELVNTLMEIGKITGRNSQSGPLAESGEIHTATITSSGSSGRQTILDPLPGQVLQLHGMNCSWDTSPGATVTFGFFVTDGTKTALIGTTSSASTDVAFESSEFFNGPFYITNGIKLQVSASTLGSASAGTLDAYTTRLR